MITYINGFYVLLVCIITFMVLAWCGGAIWQMSIKCVALTQIPDDICNFFKRNSDFCEILINQCLTFVVNNYLYIKIGLLRCVSTGVAWMDWRSCSAGDKWRAEIGGLWLTRCAGTSKAGQTNERADRQADGPNRANMRFWLVTVISQTVSRSVLKAAQTSFVQGCSGVGTPTFLYQWEHLYYSIPSVSVFKLLIFTAVKNIDLNKRTRDPDLP